jgi:hypothetical protein
MNNMVLTIENYKKIVGQSIYFKWVPKSKGWVVKDIRETDTIYEIFLKTDDPTLGMTFTIPVELERYPYYCPYTFMVKYRMQVETVHKQSASKGYAKEAYRTMDQMLEILAVVLHDMMKK